MSAMRPEIDPPDTPITPIVCDVNEQLRIAEAERARIMAEASAERRRLRRSLRVLSTAFVVVFIIAGWIALRYVRMRSAQSEQAVLRASIEFEIEQALASVHQQTSAARASTYPERDAATLDSAYAIMERVESIVREGKASEEQRGEAVRIRQELDRAYRDLTAIGKLDQIRLDNINARERRIEAATLARRYAQTFEALGIETTSDRAMAAANVLREHPHRERLLAALSDWRITEPSEKKKFTLAYLLRIVEARDSFRSRLRDALIRRDDEMVAVLLKSPEMAKQPPIYLCRLSGVLRSVNRENQAIEVLQFGLSRFPGDFWLNAELGGIWLSRQPRLPENAREYFHVAVAIRPQSARANYFLGLTELRRGDLPEAATAFGRAIAKDSNFADAHLQYSAVLRAQNDLHGAIQHARKAMELSPGNPVPPSLLATVYLAQGHVEDAIVCYKTSLAAEESYLPAMLGLAEILREVGQLVEAESLVKRAADSSPEPRAAILNQLGLVKQAKGDIPGAATLFQKAIETESQDPAACVYLGIVRMAQGNRDEAMHWFQAALERDTKYAPAYVQIGLYHLARAEFREATNRLQQAIDHDPRLPSAYFHLGRVQKRVGDWNAALKAFRKAAKLKPQWVEASYLQGECALELSHMDEAVESLEKAAQLCPTNHPLFGSVHLLLQRLKLRQLQEVMAI